MSIRARFEQWVKLRGGSERDLVRSRGAYVNPHRQAEWLGYEAGYTDCGNLILAAALNQPIFAEADEHKKTAQPVG